MKTSILSTEKRCYICGKQTSLHLHHVFRGRNRSISDENGFVVYLCETHHTDGNFGVHARKDLNEWLMQKTQRAYEETHSREEFIKLIGRSYL